MAVIFSITTGHVVEKDPPPLLKLKFHLRSSAVVQSSKEHAVQLNPPLPFPSDKLGAISNSKVFLVFLPSKGT